MKNALAASIFTALMLSSLPASEPKDMKVEAILDTLLFYDPEHRHVRNATDGDRPQPLSVWLSRFRYWAEDGHLDVVVDLNKELVGRRIEDTRIAVTLRDQDKKIITSYRFVPPARAFAVYPEIPEVLYDGEGTVDIAWRRGDGTELGSARVPFRVAMANRNLKRRGHIPIVVPNEGGARGPMAITVGVPFPRGVLSDLNTLRLRCNDKDVPFEAKEIAKWSKWGSIKWIHLTFSLELVEKPSELVLEYGASSEKKSERPMVAESSGSFPRIDVGDLRFENGLWYRPAGLEKHVKVLDEQAVTGGFVTDSDGNTYQFDRAGAYEVESAGSERVVIKTEGWYCRAGGPGERDQFCKHVTRYTIKKGAPLVHLFNTWIFTGDGNRDRIANMGWKFPLAEGINPKGFLKAFGGKPEWWSADSLLQWDYEHCDLRSSQASTVSSVHRSPGVAYVKGHGVGMLLGIKDFWQNYPSELEFDAHVLWFHNWPRNNRRAGYTFSGKLEPGPGPAADPSAARHDQYQEGRLSSSEWVLNLIQARFAHEGRELNFRLPDEATSAPVISKMKAGRPWAKYWREGEPDSINAQGISKTEEMWLYFFEETDDAASLATKVIEGLNENHLRAVVDPAWVANSGAFYEIHPQDWEKFPEAEKAYEQVALAPERWQERLGLYGKWIYGDIAGWNLGLEEREPALYRAYRKRHHGWPYSWIPYVRSGDSRLLNAADRATRHNVDANWRHYASEGRRKGLIPRSTLPWAMTVGKNENMTRTRCYESKVDYLLASWYVTGYHRAWDLFKEWVSLTKIEEDLPLRGPIALKGPWGRDSIDVRFPLTVMRSYLETYEAIFDPWFLVAYQEIAKGFAREMKEEGLTGTPYVPALREFHRYTGDETWQRFYLEYADRVGRSSWNSYIDPLFEPNGYAWLLTGDAQYLGRVRNMLEWAEASVWNGQKPDYLKGFYVRGTGHDAARTTGWMLQHLPFALYVLNKVDEKPDLVTELIEVGSREIEFLLVKSEETPLNLHLRERLQAQPSKKNVRYELTGPDGERRQDGEWMVENSIELTVAANDEPGVYRLILEDATSVVVPISQGMNIQEAMRFSPDEEVFLGGYHKQIWFFVSKEVEKFHLEICPAKNAAVRRISLWAPDGAMMWDLNNEKHTAKQADSTVITVDAELADQLWRITTPGGHLSPFRVSMDPSAVFVANPSYWSAEFEELTREPQSILMH